MTARITELWGGIEEWLQVNAPRTFATLNPPAASSYGFDMSGATVGTLAYNSKTKMFEVQTSTPSSWPHEPRSFVVDLTDGTTHIFTLGSCSGACN